MPFLTIAGITVEVQPGNAVQGESARRGSVRASFNNTLRSDVSAVRRRWTFETGPILQADALNLIAACDGGVFVAVAGDAVGGTTTAHVLVTSAPYVRDVTQALDFRRTLSLAIEEVYPGAIPTPPPPSGGTPPAAPTALAIALTATGGTLTWTDNSTDEDTFRVERAPGLGAVSGFTEIGATLANDANYDDTTAAAATPYTWRVKARSPGGDSAYSTVSGTTSAPAGLPVTTGLVWDYDPGYLPPASGDQTHAARVGPTAQRGATTAAESTDPTHVPAAGGVPGHWAFDADDYLFFPDHAALDATWAGPFTIVHCLQQPTIEATRELFNRDDEASARELWTALQSGAPLLIVCYGGTAADRTNYLGTALATGRHVVAFTHNPALARSGRVLIYVAGVVQATPAGETFGSDGTIAATIADTRLGRRGGSNPGIAAQGRTLVYNRILTAAEHASVANFLIGQGWA